MAADPLARRPHHRRPGDGLAVSVDDLLLLQAVGRDLHPTTQAVAAGPDAANYQTAFGTGNFYISFWNSFYIAAVVTAVSLLTCAMAAYAFARLRFPGNNVLFAIFLATMMVPMQLTIIPLYIILGWLHWIDTHLSIIVPAALFNAFGVFLLRQYVRGIPLELEEAAAIDGASRVKIFITIILPLLRTPMVALGIFIFLGQWNNFFQPLIFLNTDTLFTLPLWVNQFKGAYASDWGGLMAATSLAAVPFLIIFIIAQRQIVEGIALRGRRHNVLKHRQQRTWSFSAGGGFTQRR